MEYTSTGEVNTIECISEETKIMLGYGTWQPIT